MYLHKYFRLLDPNHSMCGKRIFVEEISRDGLYVSFRDNMGYYFTAHVGFLKPLPALQLIRGGLWGSPRA